MACVCLAEGRAWSFVALTSVAFYVRPEAGLLGLLGTAWLALSAPRAERVIVLLRTTVAFVLLVGPYLVWKQWYFGSIVPMTIRAKEPVPLQGLAYVAENLLPIAGVLVLAAVLLWRKELSRKRKVLLALWAIYALATVGVGPDWMPRGRLMVPMLAVLFLAVDGALVASVARRNPVWCRVLALAGCLLFVGVSAAWSVDLHGRYRGQLEEDKRLAALIHALHEGGIRSIATVNIGLVGYTAMDIRVIDLVGLCDAHIGRLPGAHLAKAPDATYLASRNIDAFILTSSHPITMGKNGGGTYTPDFRVENHIFQLPWFQRNYGYQGTLALSATDYYHVFVKQRAVTGRVR